MIEIKDKNPEHEYFRKSPSDRATLSIGKLDVPVQQPNFSPSAVKKNIEPVHRAANHTPKTKTR